MATVMKMSERKRRKVVAVRADGIATVAIVLTAMIKRSGESVGEGRIGMMDLMTMTMPKREA